MSKKLAFLDDIWGRKPQLFTVPTIVLYDSKYISLNCATRHYNQLPEH